MHYKGSVFLVKAIRLILLLMDFHKFSRAPNLYTVDTELHQRAVIY